MIPGKYLPNRQLHITVNWFREKYGRFSDTGYTAYCILISMDA